MQFGVLGDAKIARTKLLPAIRAAGHEVTHLGRRDASTGADPVWGPVTVTSYEGLLQDPQVDAVYNALPNHLSCAMEPSGTGGWQAGSLRETGCADC